MFSPLLKTQLFLNSVGVEVHLVSKTALGFLQAFPLFRLFVFTHFGCLKRPYTCKVARGPDTYAVPGQGSFWRRFEAVWVAWLTGSHLSGTWCLFTWGFVYLVDSSVLFKVVVFLGQLRDLLWWFSGMPWLETVRVLHLVVLLNQTRPIRLHLTLVSRALFALGDRNTRYRFNCLLISSLLDRGEEQPFANPWRLAVSDGDHLLLHILQSSLTWNTCVWLRCSHCLLAVFLLKDTKVLPEVLLYYWLEGVRKVQFGAVLLGILHQHEVIWKLQADWAFVFRDGIDIDSADATQDRDQMVLAQCTRKQR